MKVKKANKIVNIILLCQVILILACGICIGVIFIPLEEECDSQRLAILNYMEEEQFVGMTVDECVKLLGEPLMEDGKKIYFDGGSERFVCIYYSSYQDYELKLTINESGVVEYVSYDCTLSIQK